MMTSSFTSIIYFAMIISYFLSISLFFVDLLRENKTANRIGIIVLALVWILESVFLLERMQFDHVLPFFTSLQATVFFSWLLITVSILMNLFWRVDYVSFFVSLLGFIFVAFDAIVHTHPQIQHVRQGDLLFLHVSVSLLSYIAFSLSAIFSVLYLMEERALHSKHFTSGPFKRLPSLERLDFFAFRSAFVGLPLLVLGMVFGSLWYKLLEGRFLFFDAKILVSTLVFLLYALYLSLRLTGKIRGRLGAWSNIIAYVVVMANFLIVGEFISKFHHW